MRQMFSKGQLEKLIKENAGIPIISLENATTEIQNPKASILKEYIASNRLFALRFKY